MTIPMHPDLPLHRFSCSLSAKGSLEGQDKDRVGKTASSVDTRKYFNLRGIENVS